MSTDDQPAPGEHEPDERTTADAVDGVDDTGDAADDLDSAVASGGSPTRPLSDDDIRDALPEDLDAAGYVGPYLFPNNNRRRIPGFIYLGLAAGCLALWWSVRGQDPVLVSDGIAWAGVGLAAVGVYSLLAGWNLEVDERDALVAAVRDVGFPVGHASAQMGWRGLRSRPTWKILLYSAEDPPTKRGLVLVDGVDGHIVEGFVEDNPEDWSALSA